MTEYTLYQIRHYESLLEIGDAVVAAESPTEALSLLEKHLKNDPNINKFFRDGDWKLKIRKDGYIEDSHKKINEKGVLYPFYTR